MSKIKIALVLLLVCFTAIPVFAEEAPEPAVFNNAVGFVFIPSKEWADDVNAGLQYQHWFNKIGLSLTAGMYYDQHHDFGTYSNEIISTKLDWKVLAGMQFNLCTFDVTNLKMIKDDTVIRLYFWLNGGLGGKDEDYDRKNVAYLYAGTGIGLEGVFWKHISIPFELGYSGQFLNDGGFDVYISSGMRFRF